MNEKDQNPDYVHFNSMQIDQGSGDKAIYNPYNIHKYTTNTFLLHPGNSNTQRYYDALKAHKDKKYILDDEKPWILAYEVGGIITF